MLTSSLDAIDNQCINELDSTDDPIESNHSDTSNNSSKTDESLSDNNSQQNVPNNKINNYNADDETNSGSREHINTIETTNNGDKTNSNSPESSDDTSSEQLRSCLSRRTSSIASVKKRVIYNESKEFIPNVSLSSPPPSLPDDLALDLHTDDDEVFSDSISPQLPRGDMCTPYPKKKSSIPGLMYLPDWFSDDRLLLYTFLY